MTELLNHYILFEGPITNYIEIDENGIVTNVKLTGQENIRQNDGTTKPVDRLVTELEKHKEDKK